MYSLQTAQVDVLVDDLMRIDDPPLVLDVAIAASDTDSGTQPNETLQLVTTEVM